MSFQENLKYFREKAGYKQAKDFAKVLDIPYPTYVGYESQGREPKYQTLCKIADLLNVSTDELLGRENNILGTNEDERLKKTIDDLLQYANFNSNIEVLSIDSDSLTFSSVVANNENNSMYSDCLTNNGKKIFNKSINFKVEKKKILKWLKDIRQKSHENEGLLLWAFLQKKAQTRYNTFIGEKIKANQLTFKEAQNIINWRFINFYDSEFHGVLWFYLEGAYDINLASKLDKSYFPYFPPKKDK